MDKESVEFMHITSFIFVLLCLNIWCSDNGECSHHSLFNNSPYLCYFFRTDDTNTKVYYLKQLGPSQLGRDRIEKLNAIGFQWRLRPERVKWEDRFEVRAYDASGHSSLIDVCARMTILSRCLLNSNKPTVIVVYRCRFPIWANGRNTNVINMYCTCVGSHRR